MVKVIDDWFLESDSYNYVLKKYTSTTQDKEGNPVMNFSNITFHNDVTSALKFLMKIYQREKLKEKLYSSLEDYLKELDRINKDFERILINIKNMEVL